MTREKQNNKSPASEAEQQENTEAACCDAEAAVLDPKIQEQLGRVFRCFCDDLVRQPIPDKLVVLLAQLEAKQRGKK